MENPESNMKPQQTGGLKLMTVFVVVLALHVVVIGGMTTYYLFKGGSSDTDLTGDKNHKGLKANADGSLVADGTLPDAIDKTAAAATPAPDTSSTPTPATAATPAPDQTASDATPAPTPATDSAPTPTPLTTPVALAPPPATPTPAAVSTPVTTPVVPTTIAKTGLVTTPASTPVPITSDLVTTTSPAGGAPYVVAAGDSCAKIAHKNHISVAHLMAANNMTSDKLSIGQKLVIPAKTPSTLGTTLATPATTATPDVATTSSLTPPADPAQAAPVKEKKAKSVATAKPAKTPAAKTVAESHSYTIVKGDTLTKIAHKFKTTPSALMAANNISDPTKLKIGNKLTIPAKEAHTATTTTPTVVQPAQVMTKKAAAQLANVTQ